MTHRKRPGKKPHKASTRWHKVIVEMWVTAPRQDIIQHLLKQRPFVPETGEAMEVSATYDGKIILRLPLLTIKDHTVDFTNASPHRRTISTRKKRRGRSPPR